MALLIFPIGALLGWLVRAPKRAAALTVAAGLSGLVLFVVLGSSTGGVSPIESAILLLGTPLAAVLAFQISRWRSSRRSIRT